MQRQVENNVDVLGKSRFAVYRACVGAHEHVRNTKIFKRVNRMAEKVNLLHESASARLLSGSARSSSRDDGREPARIASTLQFDAQPTSWQRAPPAFSFAESPRRLHPTSICPRQATETAFSASIAEVPQAYASGPNHCHSIPPSTTICIQQKSLEGTSGTSLLNRSRLQRHQSVMSKRAAKIPSRQRLSQLGMASTAFRSANVKLPCSHRNIKSVWPERHELQIRTAPSRFAQLFRALLTGSSNT